MTLSTKLISLLLLANICIANASVIGKVYNVIEPDALSEIEQRAQKVDWNKVWNKDKRFWLGTQMVSLPKATENKTRKYVPWYTTKFDIKNAKGQIMYPKGYTFNPLQYTKLPQRLVVTSSKSHVFIKEKLLPMDMIILTDGDPFKLTDKEKRPFFVLDKQLQERLGVKVEPSIVSQIGSAFNIEEVVIEEAENA